MNIDVVYPNFLILYIIIIITKKSYTTGISFYIYIFSSKYFCSLSSYEATIFIGSFLHLLLRWFTLIVDRIFKDYFGGWIPRRKWVESVINLKAVISWFASNGKFILIHIIYSEYYENSQEYKNPNSRYLSGAQCTGRWLYCSISSWNSGSRGQRGFI